MKIITPVVNNPTFIEIQHETLKKHMKCPYEFIVFNDAKRFPDFTNGGDPGVYDAIVETCKRLGIFCMDIPNDHHRSMTNAMLRCADSYNFILKFMRQYPAEYLVLDSDMFLVCDFTGGEYSDSDAAIVLQRRDDIHYFWNGLFYFNTARMKNVELLNWTPLINTDVGGGMAQWLYSQTSAVPNTEALRHSPIQYKNNGIYYMRHLWSCSWDASELPAELGALRAFLEADPRNKEGKFFCEIYDGRFLHYRAGGNWAGEGMELHRRLSTELKRLLVGE